MSKPCWPRWAGASFASSTSGWRRGRAINAFYREALADLPGIGFMPEASFGRSTYRNILSSKP